jgi:Tol biopolymer transport system component
VYQSNQSGQWEIWLQRFPATGSPYQVSQGGGVRGMWLPDGKSIVFQHAADVMIAAVSETGVAAL